MTTQTTLAAWRTTWERLPPRDRRAVTLAAVVVGLALVWWVALSPALTTLRQAGPRQATLDTQLASMQALANQARQLKNQPPLSRDDSLRALESATTRHLGEQARLTVMGDQATVTLTDVPPQPLALWLSEVRANARITPTEARLTQGQAPGAQAAAPTPAPQPAWKGTVVFSLAR